MADDPKNMGTAKTIMAWGPNSAPGAPAAPPPHAMQPQPHAPIPQANAWQPQGSAGWPQAPQAQAPYQPSHPSPQYSPQPQPAPYAHGQSPQFGQAYAQQPHAPNPALAYPPQAANAYPQAANSYRAAANPYPQVANPYHAPQPAPAAPVAAPPAMDPAARPIPSADATAGVSDRVRFIRLTYAHLLGAILVFAGLLYLFMTNSFLIEKVSWPLVRFSLAGRWQWGVVLAAFAAASWVADYWASHATSRTLQYVGLLFYTLAEALIFVPLLAIVEWKTHELLSRGGHEPHIIRDSAFVTLAIFTALTASVMFSKKDFSFLRSGLAMASAAAMMLVILSLIFGFNLGIVFSVAMVLLAAGYILFQTSQVLAHYDPRNHVAAALALFSSVALMFWYVIRIFLRMRTND